MPSPELIDERFDEIVRELRTLPGAPESLRERVRELAAQEPAVQAPSPARWRTWLTFRSAGWTVASVGAGFVAVALAYGVITSGGGDTADQSAAPSARSATLTTAGDAELGSGGVPTAAEPRPLQSDNRVKSPPPEPAAPAGTTLEAASGARRDATTLPPGQRLAQYTASMRLRVSDIDELSRTTREAMQVARGLGGFVASVNYATPKG
jgi:hypothetical protein